MLRENAHGCDAEDVDMSLKSKTCQPASGAQDSQASLELHEVSQDFSHKSISGVIMLDGITVGPGPF